MPFGRVVMLVHELPAGEVNTSSMLPVLDSPMADGASEQRTYNCLRTSPRFQQTDCCAAAGREKPMKTSAAKLERNIVHLLGLLKTLLSFGFHYKIEQYPCQFSPDVPNRLISMW